MPVKLYSATESKSVSFHEVHVSDRGRARQGDREALEQTLAGLR